MGVLLKGVFIDLRAGNFVHAKTQLRASCLHACHRVRNLLSPGLGLQIFTPFSFLLQYFTSIFYFKNFTSILGEHSSNKKNKKVKKSLPSNLDSSELEQESSSNNNDNGNNFVDFKQYHFLQGLIFVKQLHLVVFYDLQKKLSTNRKQKTKSN